MKSLGKKQRWLSETAGSWVTLNTSHPCSVPQFPYLKIGINWMALQFWSLTGEQDRTKSMCLYKVWVKREANRWDHRGREPEAGETDIQATYKQGVRNPHEDLWGRRWRFAGGGGAQPVWLQKPQRRQVNLHAQGTSLSGKEDRRKKTRISYSWAHCFAPGIPKPRGDKRRVLSEEQGCCRPGLLGLHREMSGDCSYYNS